MSITIEGGPAPADFVERLLERAADHPEEYGLSHDVGDRDFTWEEVARVVDHEGVADGRIDERDGSVFVTNGRLSPSQFQAVVRGIHSGLGGRSSSVSVDPCAAARLASRRSATESHRAIERVSLNELMTDPSAFSSHVEGALELMNENSLSIVALTSCTAVYSIP